MHAAASDAVNARGKSLFASRGAPKGPRGGPPGGASAHEEDADSGGSESSGSEENQTGRSNEKEKTLKSWSELTERQKHAELIKATKKYCQRAYKKTKLLKVKDSGFRV